MEVNPLEFLALLEIVFLALITNTHESKPPVLKFYQINNEDDNRTTIYDSVKRHRDKQITVEKGNVTTEFLLQCNASYPVELIYKGNGIPIMTSSTQRHVDLKNFNLPKTYRFTANMKMIGRLEGNSGFYTCRALDRDQPNSETTVYIFIPGNRLFLLDPCESVRYIELENQITNNSSVDHLVEDYCNDHNLSLNIEVLVYRNTSWVDIPCSVSNSKTKVILYKVSSSTGNWTYLKPNESYLIYDARIGFKLRYADLIDPFSDHYVCAGNFVNTLILVKLVEINDTLPAHYSIRTEMNDEQFVCSTSSPQGRLRKSGCNSIVDCNILKTRLRNFYYLNFVTNLTSQVLFLNISESPHNIRNPTILHCSIGRGLIESILFYHFKSTQFVIREDEFPVLPITMQNNILDMEVVRNEVDLMTNNCAISCEGPSLFVSDHFVWKIESSIGTKFFQSGIMKQMSGILRSIFTLPFEYQNLNVTVTCFAPLWYSSTEWTNKSLDFHVDVKSRTTTTAPSAPSLAISSSSRVQVPTLSDLTNFIPIICSLLLNHFDLRR